MLPTKKIYLSPPNMSSIEKNLLLNAFDSNWIAPLGPEVDKFEKEMSKYLNISGSASLCSGTAGLHLALRILGVGEKDRVICPTLTFAASANVILYEKAIPIFIDVNPETWTLDVHILESVIKKFKPKALLSVDLYGESCDYENITHLCNKYNVSIIQDTAEGLGSEYKGTKLGSQGDIGVLSFNGNKIITTGGGGMLISENQDYVKKAKFLASQAREPFIHYQHKELGFNYRLSNLLASVGRGQLKRLDKFVSQKRKVFRKYYDSLSKFEGITFMREASFSRSNRWLTTILIDTYKVGFSPHKLIDSYAKERIETRPIWKPMHLQPLYKDYDYIKLGEKDISRDLFNKGICLPSGTNLLDSEQDRIIDIFISKLSK